MRKVRPGNALASRLVVAPAAIVDRRARRRCVRGARERSSDRVCPHHSSIHGGDGTSAPLPRAAPRSDFDAERLGGRHVLARERARYDDGRKRLGKDGKHRRLKSDALAAAERVALWRREHNRDCVESSAKLATPEVKRADTGRHYGRRERVGHGCRID